MREARPFGIGVVLGIGLLGAGFLLSGCGSGTPSGAGVSPEVASAGWGGASRPAAPGEIPGRYIVVLKEGVSPAEVARGHRVNPDLVYRHALNGFAGKASAAQAKALEKDARVLSIEPDRVVTVPEPDAVVQTRAATAVAMTVPTGVRRIRADLNPAVDVSSVGIAIIDSGIAPHRDLNLVGGISYVSGVTSYYDDNGHGTHVAGTAAARTNHRFGVRGVAPNARLYAVKVLDSSNSGTLSAVVAGVNWVTQNAASLGIRVANMSLGSPTTSSSLNTAITNSVAAGVTYAVAACNNSTDAANYSPANHPSVICVSALADSDGKCGALGAATGYGNDDRFASFSNYGSVVDLAAPGVNILSTARNGGLATMSGTSMATPHVTGAAALYIAHHPGVAPAEVLSALLAAAAPQSPVTATLDSFGLLWGGFSGDRDTYHEPLVDAARL